MEAYTKAYTERIFFFLLTTINSFLCGRHRAECLVHIISLTLHNNPLKYYSELIIEKTKA